MKKRFLAALLSAALLIGTCMPVYANSSTGSSDIPPETPVEEEVVEPQELVCTCPDEEGVDKTAEGYVHLEGCPKYVAPKTPNDSKEPEELVCTCPDEEGVDKTAEGYVHQEGCPKYVAPEEPVCTCPDVEGVDKTAEDYVHQEGCPLYQAPEEPIGMTDEQRALYEAILACKTYEEYEALMNQTDSTLVDAMSANLSAEENQTLSDHMATLYQLQTLEVVSVTIEDTIKTNGSLTAKVTPSSEGYTYQWYVSEDGKTFTKIENTTTVTGTEQTMYVARDGAQKYYKVEIYQNGALKATSDPYRVPYFNALMNGSFEVPENNGTNAGPQYKEAQVPYWSTTGKGTGNKQGKDIEILSVCKEDSISNFNLTKTSGDENLLKAEVERNWFSQPIRIKRYTGVPDGTQCAELNCEAWGALYQDVLTEPGSTLYWSFYHRGRFGIKDNQMDEMQLIIIDADDIPAGWNPAGTDNTKGVQGTFKANATEWKYHSGTYTVPEGQYVTRFYFVSTESYNGSKQSHGTEATVGNYLDKITFGKDVPQPPEDYSNLTITKAVNDADGKDIGENVPAESFTFEVKKDSTTVATVKLPTRSGEWSYTLLNLDPGEYTVTETGYNLDGFDYQSTTINGTVTLSSSSTVNMTKGSATTVNFVNNYKEQQVTINYTAVGPVGATGFGSVNPTSETLGVFTGVAQGSMPTAGSGYKFVGWYTDEACTTPVNSTWVVANKLTPEKNAEGKNVAATYYAKFESDLTSLTIEKSGGQTGEKFIMTVSGPDLNMKVVVPAGGSVTISGLKVGETYTVTEDRSWAWRYNITGGGDITLSATGDNTVTVTNTLTKNQWLSGSGYCKNQWNSDGTITATH